MRHIRLAEIRCFDRKVFSLTFAFLHIYYALQLWQHVLQKRPQQLASKKLLKLHKVTVFGILKIRNLLVCYVMPTA